MARRLFIAKPLTEGEDLLLTDQPAHYLLNVLRLKTGEALYVFNGDGFDYCAKLLKIQRKAVHLVLGDKHLVAVESPLHIHLGLGISSGKRMDYAIQKAIELGINELSPVVVERSQQGRIAAQKHAHWQQVMISALEQSGRSVLPQFHPVQPFTEFIQGNADFKAILHPHHHLAPTLDTLSKPQRVMLLIGPEGGFTSSEVTTATLSGFLPVQLGPRILRTETAPLVMISILQYLFGDLR